MVRPRSYDDATGRALVAAAARRLAEDGAAGLSVRAVAAEVGASTRAIYAVFGSKAGLVRAVFATGFATLSQHLARVEPSGDPWAEVLALGLAYRDSALAEPHLYEVMFGRPVVEFEPTEEDTALAVATLDRLRQAVARAAASSGLPDGLDVEGATLSLWSRVHGLATLELAGAFGDRGRELWEASLRADQAGWRHAGAPGDGAAAVSRPG